MTDQYLDLLKKTLTGWNLKDDSWSVAPQLGESSIRVPFNAALRYDGRDWPTRAETMVGLKRLDHIHHLLDTIRMDGIQGDFVECGIWRGGVCIFANEYFRTHDMKRYVYGFDSFEGLPAPSLPQDHGDRHHEWNDVFAVSREQVVENFATYSSDMRRVVLVEGWFKDTVCEFNGAISLLRVDGDMYEGTMDPLRFLYRFIQPGGYVVIDDYGDVSACRAAVRDFREAFEIQEPLERMGHTVAFWRKHV